MWVLLQVQRQDIVGVSLMDGGLLASVSVWSTYVGIISGYLDPGG